MSLVEALARVAAEAGDEAKIAGPDGRFGYPAFARQADALAAHLESSLEVKAGDRICYLGCNSIGLLALVFAAARLGAMVCPLNWRLADEELAWIVDDADPALVLSDTTHLDRAGTIAKGRPAGAMPHLPGLPDGAHVRADQPGPDTAVLLVYTSGATGRPKGAVLTQRAVAANARLSWDMHAMTSTDHVLTALPMFHVGGLNIQTLPALLCGARVTVMDRFEPGACLAAIREARPSLTVQVPATFQALMAHPAWERTDLSCLRAIATGSTDVPVPLIRAVHARGVPVIQIYGATETGPVVVYQKPEDAEARIGSIGRAGPGVTVQITGPDGTALPDGEAGEIWLCSPTLASGYWCDDAANAAFAGGWFRTGDVAWRDPDGFFWFADRIKNVIISGGENIYPAEIERVIAALPDVREVSVVGRTHPRWGQVPVAVVVSRAKPSEAEVSRATLLTALEGRLARFKHPKDVVFVDALPRNAMGKVEVEKVKALADASA